MLVWYPRLLTEKTSSLTHGKERYISERKWVLTFILGISLRHITSLHLNMRLVIVPSLHRSSSNSSVEIILSLLPCWTKSLLLVHLELLCKLCVLSVLFFVLMMSRSIAKLLRAWNRSREFTPSRRGFRDLRADRCVVTAAFVRRAR